MYTQGRNEVLYLFSPTGLPWWAKRHTYGGRFSRSRTKAGARYKHRYLTPSTDLVQRVKARGRIKKGEKRKKKKKKKNIQVRTVVVSFGSLIIGQVDLVSDR